MAKRKKLKETKKEILLNENKISNKNLLFLLILLLALLTFLSFIPVLYADFLKLDDDYYLLKNKKITNGITVEGLKYAFSKESFSLGFYFPLTIISHQIDFSLYKMNAKGHHFTNLLIHILNTTLLFYFFYLATQKPLHSFLISILFAIHPLRVEVVAWIFERKELLSTFFAFITLIFYSYYIKRKKFFLYFLSILFFLLALLSKTMVITLPVVLLFFDIWPFKRMELFPFFKRENLKIFLNLLVEKIPFFILTILFSVLTIFAQKSVSAIAPLESLTLYERIANATISYSKYILKIFFPINLAPIYPLKPEENSLFLFLCSLIFITTITLFILFLKKDFLFVGWFYYLITLLPVIGLIQVGIQAMADRYTYIPSIGLLIILVFSFSHLKINRIYYGLALLIIIILSILTFSQSKKWKNSYSLFFHTINVTDRNYAAYYYLGKTFLEDGDLESAKNYLEKSLSIKNDYGPAHCNLGLLYAKKGDYQKSKIFYEKALMVYPFDNDIKQNLANCFYYLGDIKKAIEIFETIPTEKRSATMLTNLGICYGTINNIKKAKENFTKALEKDPEYIDALINLAVAYMYEHKLNEAEEFLKKAQKLDPENHFLKTNYEILKKMKEQLNDQEEKRKDT